MISEITLTLSLSLSLSLSHNLGQTPLIHVHFHFSTLSLRIQNYFKVISSLIECLKVIPKSFKQEPSFISSFHSKTHLNLEGIKTIFLNMFLILGDENDSERFHLFLDFKHKT
ncbi:hypothetical protein Hanom_Chr03g00239661 [Helianthus anomalus]